MILPLILQLAVVPVCDVLADRIDLDLRVAGECRVSGVPDPDARESDLPYRTLRVDGFDERALSKLRNGLDHWWRVTTPLAEANLRGSIGNAFDDFEDAIELEPRLTEAAIAAAELALRTRLEDDMRRAIGIAGRAADRTRAEPYVAELWLSLGERDSVRLDPLLESPDGWRAAAIALLMRDDPRAWARGDSLYFEAARAEGAALRRATGDVQPLMPELEQASARDLERVWDALAAEAAVARPERLHIHFERLIYAYEAYYDWPRVGARGSLDDLTTRFDMRGAMYLRHGAPDQRIVSVSGPQLPDRPIYESWVYDRGWNGAFATHFSGYGRDWRMLASVPGCDRDWIESRAVILPALMSVALACRQGDPTGMAGSRVAEVNAAMSADHRAAIQSQSVDLGLRELLVARGSAHRLRDAAGRPELLVVAGVAVDPGMTDTLGVGAAFTLDMDAYVASGGGGSHAATSRTMCTTAVGEPGYATLTVSLPAPPTPGLVRVVLRDADSTSVGAALSTNVAGPPRDEGIAMSDALPLSLDAPTTIERYGRALAPMPDVVGLDRFGLYFELYDLPEDAETYEATIRARRVEDGVFAASDAISLTFDGRLERVAPATAAELLEIAAPSWEPGEYVLEIRVRVEAEERARSRTLRVEG